MFSWPTLLTVVALCGALVWVAIAAVPRLAGQAETPAAAPLPGDRSVPKTALRGEGGSPAADYGLPVEVWIRVPPGTCDIVLDRFGVAGVEIVESLAFVGFTGVSRIGGPSVALVEGQSHPALHLWRVTSKAHAPHAWFKVVLRWPRDAEHPTVDVSEPSGASWPAVVLTGGVGARSLRPALSLRQPAGRPAAWWIPPLP